MMIAMLYCVCVLVGWELMASGGVAIGSMEEM